MCTSIVFKGRKTFEEVKEISEHHMIYSEPGVTYQA